MEVSGILQITDLLAVLERNGINFALTEPNAASGYGLDEKKAPESGNRNLCLVSRLPTDNELASEALNRGPKGKTPVRLIEPYDKYEIDEAGRGGRNFVSPIQSYLDARAYGDADFWFISQQVDPKWSYAEWLRRQFIQRGWGVEQ